MSREPFISFSSMFMAGGPLPPGQSGLKPLRHKYLLNAPINVLLNSFAAGILIFMDYKNVASILVLINVLLIFHHYRVTAYNEKVNQHNRGEDGGLYELQAIR